MKDKKIFFILAGLALTMSAGSAHGGEGWTVTSGSAGDAWTVSLTPQAVVGNYASSSLRQNFQSGGLFVGLDYLERGGITLGYARTHVGFTDATTNIDQDSYYASGRMNLAVDKMQGTVGLRLDGHYINNDDASGSTDNVRVLAPVVSYVPYDQKYAIDMGYARSHYNKFTANQLTPTLSMALNDGAEWLQLRGYIVNFSKPPVDNDGKDQTVALDAKITHWLAPDNLLKMDNVKAGVLVGERMYGVEMDGASVYNLGDMQQGAASVGAEWRLGDRTNLTLFTGHEWYEDIEINDKYGSDSLYLSLSNKW